MHCGLNPKNNASLVQGATHGTRTTGISVLGCMPDISTQNGQVDLGGNGVERMNFMSIKI